jgi:hypothetical protein
MGLSKHQEHAMNALGIFLIENGFRIVRRILLSTLERWAKICLYAKYTLMILALVLLTNPFVMSLEKIMTDRFQMSMMGVLTFLVFKSSKPRRGPSLAK